MTEDRADDVDYCSRGEVPPEAALIVEPLGGILSYARISPTVIEFRGGTGRLRLPDLAPHDTADLRAQRIARNSLDDACDREADAVLRAEAAEVALAAAAAREARLRAGIETIAANLDAPGDYGVADGIDDLRALLADADPGRQS